MKTAAVSSGLRKALTWSGLSFGLMLASSADAEGWKVYWKEGTRFESEDGRFKLKFGGRVQADFSFADEGNDFAPGLSLEDGSEFRRARLALEGTVYSNVEFKIEYDWATGSAEAKDIYIGFRDIPYLGDVRVGHVKEPFSFEELTSSRFINFVERSAIVEAFVPSRNLGFLAQNAVVDDRFVWQLGAFQDSDNFGKSTGGNWNFTGRVAGTPIYANEGKNLLHLGVAYSLRDPEDNAARFRARPGAHLAPRLVDTGYLTVDAVDLLGLEVVTVAGPFWAQGEFMQASVDSTLGRFASGDLSGYSIEAGWFLTGEHKNYRKNPGSFDRLKPQADFLRGSGAGAWELLLRYEELDLHDGGIVGGEQDGFTVGLNWYANPITRVMLNYVSTDSTNNGEANFLLLRFGIDF